MSLPRVRRCLLTLVVLAAVVSGAAPAGALEDEGAPEPLGKGITVDDLFAPPPLAPDGAVSQSVAAENDIVFPAVAPSSQFAAPAEVFAGDPLRLAVYPQDNRRYTLGADKIGVYLCRWNGSNGGVDLDVVTAVLNTDVKDYFTTLSGAGYSPTFTKRATVTLTSSSPSQQQCQAAVANPAVKSDNAALIVMDDTSNGGLATSGVPCTTNCGSAPTTYPANGRWAVVGGDSLMAPDSIPPIDYPHVTTAVHEIGHMLGWPHSNSSLFVTPLPDYDNPIDVMSGNLSATLDMRVDTPYATPAWNRYRAGWISPNQVLVYTGGVQTLKVAPAGKAGTQMIVFPSAIEYSFVTLDARRSTAADPDLPDNFEGVTAHYIEQIGGCFVPPGENVGVCWGLNSGVYSYPPAPENLNHVTKPGGTKTMDLDRGAQLVAHGALVRVLSGDDSGYTVKLVGFSDTAGSVFLGDIIWLADNGITKGCGPTTFCPDDNVTRGQMAAFLVRALGLTARDPGIDFADDNGSVFENDIESLATAGITKGCNPPANTNFCPDENVTRGQMAAFLVRALGLTARDPGIDFADDNGSVFENDIESLATAGITKGCNPPANTDFCPVSSVTRGQMAAFLQRSSAFFPG